MPVNIMPGCCRPSLRRSGSEDWKNRGNQAASNGFDDVVGDWGLEY